MHRLDVSCVSKVVCEHSAEISSSLKHWTSWIEALFAPYLVPAELSKAGSAHVRGITQGVHVALQESGYV